MRSLLLLVGLAGSAAALHKGLFFGGNSAQSKDGYFQGREGRPENRHLDKPETRAYLPPTPPYRQQRSEEDLPLIRNRRPISPAQNTLKSSWEEKLEKGKEKFELVKNSNGDYIPAFLCGERGYHCNGYRRPYSGVLKDHPFVKLVGEEYLRSRYPGQSERRPNVNTKRDDCSERGYHCNGYRKPNSGGVKKVDPFLNAVKEEYPRERYPGHLERKPSGRQYSRVHELKRIQKTGNSPADTY